MAIETIKRIIDGSEVDFEKTAGEHCILLEDDTRIKIAKIKRVDCIKVPEYIEEETGEYILFSWIPAKVGCESTRNFLIPGIGLYPHLTGKKSEISYGECAKNGPKFYIKSIASKVYESPIVGIEGDWCGYRFDTDCHTSIF